VRDFCIASIKQRVAFNVYANLLLHFTAVLGIDTGTLAWKMARHFTPHLAGIMWCNRMLMLDHFCENQADDPVEVTAEEFDEVKEQIRKWLASGTGTPMGAIIRWMSYGRGHRNMEGGTATVMWEESGEVLRYLGEAISITDFCYAARDALDGCEQLIDAVFFGAWLDEEGSPGLWNLVKMAEIKDIATMDGVGRSFATNPDNSERLFPGPQGLAELGRRRGRLWDPVARRIRPEKAREWQALLRRFKLSLLVCTHLWSGQPARGPELMTMAHCDTRQLPRSLFIFDGQVMLVTDRDKAKAIRGVGRKVARFLPERLGRIAVAYVTWVIPFERFLCQQTGAALPAADEDHWLWKDASAGAGKWARWDTSTLSAELKKLTGRGLGVELTTSAYRHVAIEIGRKIRGLVVRQAEAGIGGGGGGNNDYDDYDDDDAPDAMTGESRGAPRL
jgi:hypothetical protein